MISSNNYKKHMDKSSNMLYNNNYSNYIQNRGDVSMLDFMMDVEGHINSIKLSTSNGLFALFEAIVNSIQSIEDSENKNNGKIEVYAYREDSDQVNISGEVEDSSFIKFIIKDNGRGFVEDNYSSFMTAYSQYKLTKGCKGIGRFLWLKTFEKVHVESIFKQDESWMKREFDFSREGIEPNDNISETQSSEFTTLITLDSYLPIYRNKTTKKFETLAKKIIEHCLLYFINDKCPKITLINCNEERIDLNDYFNKFIHDELHHDTFEIKGEEFKLYHLCIPQGTQKNELHFCADNRDVYAIDLKKSIPELNAKLKDDNGNTYFYLGYLMGDYLNRIVNTNRTAFDYRSDDTKYIDEKDIIDNAKNLITSYLSDEIKSIATQKKEEIDDYINNKNPKYRNLTYLDPDLYTEIPAHLSETELELELHKRVQKCETDLLVDKQNIEKKIEKNEYDSEFDNLLNTYCKKVDKFSKSSLAEYIIRRKAILDVLSQSMKYLDTDKKKYTYEKNIHQLIFPMRHTSDDIGYMDHNLWIIDEKLAYHHYLASDKKISTLEPLDNNDKQEPDIIVFDSSFALSDEKDQPYRNITIVEFKRPGRDNYNEAENPMNQIKKYMEAIMDGKVKTKDGLTLDNSENFRFFCYIVADITPSFDKQIRRSDMKKTPDQLGYFQYIDNYFAYVEIIPYNKLIQDAQKRNRILFDKLFSPKYNDVDKLDIEK